MSRGSGDVRFSVCQALFYAPDLEYLISSRRQLIEAGTTMSPSGQTRKLRLSSHMPTCHSWQAVELGWNSGLCGTRAFRSYFTLFLEMRPTQSR